MRKLYIKLILLLILMVPANAHAFWVWTPETNKWINPKYAVKETPSEQLEYAMSFYEQKDYAEAMGEFRKLIKHYPRSREAPEAQFYYAKCLEDQGKLFAAYKEYQTVVDKYPFSERSAEIVPIQFSLANSLLEGKGEKNAILDAFSGADYNIIEIYKAVIKNAPYGPLAPEAQYKIGLYLMENNLFQEARDEFEKVTNDYPNSEWAKAAKFQIAVTDAKRSTSAQYDQKITKVAVEEFKEFVENYPQAELSQKAKEKIYALREKEAENNFLVAQFYEKQKNFTAAKIYYETIVDDYHDSSWAVKALERLRTITPKIK